MGGKDLISEAQARYLDGYAIVPIPRAGYQYRDRNGELQTAEGKGPIIPGWQKQRLAWEDLDRRLSADYIVAIGAVAGRLSGNKADLDFDGAGWAGTFTNFMNSWPQLERTRIAKTGSGKRHVWIHCPDMPAHFTVRTFTRQDLDASIELRGNGSNCVLPPSLHPSGGRYEWLDPDADLVTVPFGQIIEWLADWSGEQAEKGQETDEQRPMWVTELLKGVTEHGTNTRHAAGRDDAAFKLTCYFHSLRMPADIISSLLADWDLKNNPPLGEAVIRTKVSSVVTRYAQGEEPAEPEPPPWEETAADHVPSVLDWVIYTPQDALAQREPLQYVVRKLFALPSLTIVYGAPSSLKSLLMLEACICVAAGIPWLGPLPEDDETRAIETICCPTFYLDFDNGPRRMHERVAAIMKARGLDPAAIPFAYVSLPAPWLDASNTAQMGDLIELLNRANAGLSVIDHLSLVSGQADENSAQMVQVLSSFRQVTESTGGALSLVHHQRKVTGFKTRAGETLRGHSSIEAALDLALLVEREEGADTATIRSTKTRDVDVAPFGALFTYSHKPHTEELDTARFFGITVTDDRKPARGRRAVIHFLRTYDGKPNRTALVDGARVLEDNLGRDYLRDTIDRMQRKGDLIAEPGPHRSTVYSLSQQLQW